MHIPHKNKGCGPMAAPPVYPPHPALIPSGPEFIHFLRQLLTLL